ncbi:hypothetical protein F5876DRAFT_2396, partial [Lentinula aff. lateritia]
PAVSVDLKKCFYRWYTGEGLTIRDCAARAGCSVGLVAKVLKNMENHGMVINPFSKHTGRPRELDDGDVQYICQLLKAHPTIYLDEVQQKVESMQEIN